MDKSVYPINFVLGSPVKWGSEMISQINLRKPKAKDLRGLKADLGFTELLDLTIKICDQPRGVIDDLEIEDTQKLMEIVGGFFESGLTSEKSS